MLSDETIAQSVDKLVAPVDRQKYCPRRRFEHQQGRHVPALAPDAQVQAGLGAVRSPAHRADLLATGHYVAFLESGVERFVTRDESIRMRDRHDEPIDDEAGEVNRSRFGRNNHGAGGRVHVDATMTGGIVVGRGLPRPNDDVRFGERPQPSARRRCGGGHGGGEHRHGQSDREQRLRQAGGEAGCTLLGSGVVHAAQPVKGSAGCDRNTPTGGQFVPRSRC
jgi:hypothetical protein